MFSAKTVFKSLMSIVVLSAVLSASAIAAPYAQATFGGLDKITAKVSQFVAVKDQPTRYGSLEITVRSCDMRPPEETPQTAAYVEIRQVNEEDNSVDPAPVFKGWMFAESPCLNGLEHPVYDVWLKTCNTPLAP